MDGSGEGLRETSLYLEKIAPKGSVVGYNLNPPHTFKPVNGLNFLKFELDKSYDYVVVNYYSIIRNGFDSNVLQKDYYLVYTVKADSAGLAFVYKHK